MPVKIRLNHIESGQVLRDTQETFILFKPLSNLQKGTVHKRLKELWIDGHE
jgi:hypothetical protein